MSAKALRTGESNKRPIHTTQRAKENSDLKCDFFFHRAVCTDIKCVTGDHLIFRAFCIV